MNRMNINKFASTIKVIAIVLWVLSVIKFAITHLDLSGGQLVMRQGIVSRDVIVNMLVLVIETFILLAILGIVSNVLPKKSAKIKEKKPEKETYSNEFSEAVSGIKEGLHEDTKSAELNVRSMRIILGKSVYTLYEDGTVINNKTKNEIGYYTNGQKAFTYRDFDGKTKTVYVSKLIRENFSN